VKLFPKRKGKKVDKISQKAGDKLGAWLKW
jgi:hypothetical protein